MVKTRILLVHSEHADLTLLASMLKSLGYVIEEAATDRVAVRVMEWGGVDLMLAGADPADGDALELLSYMQRKHRQVPVILLFSRPMPDRAKQALRLGAQAVLRYPLPATELRAAVLQALALPGGNAPAADVDPAPLASAPAVPKASPSAPPGAHRPGSPGPDRSAPRDTSRLARDLGIVGSDPALRQAFEMAGMIAPARTPALIFGEPGTGKSLLARMIHALGPRREQPLVVFDTAALAETLAEHIRHGDRATALANAEDDWSAKLEQARGGTLFIDEVAGLPENLQACLLRALQERDLTSSGHHLRDPDVRFLISTSANLLSLVKQERFCQDLYYRISVICLGLPPLRSRLGDIEALAEFFLDRFAHELATDIVGFTPNALEALTKRDWSGNVRELESVIRRCVIRCTGTRVNSTLLASCLSPRSTPTSSPTSRPALAASLRPLKEALQEPEKRLIIQALQALNWNRQQTARVLDINRTTLYKKMNKYGLMLDEPIWVN